LCNGLSKGVHRSGATASYPATSALPRPPRNPQQRNRVANGVATVIIFAPLAVALQVASLTIVSASSPVGTHSVSVASSTGPGPGAYFYGSPQGSGL